MIMCDISVILTVIVYNTINGDTGIPMDSETC